MDDDKKVVVKNGGIGLGTLCIFATIILAVLKVYGVISWSWLMVCAPLIVWAGLMVLILAFTFISSLIVMLIAVIVAFSDK